MGGEVGRWMDGWYEMMGGLEILAWTDVGGEVGRWMDGMRWREGWIYWHGQMWVGEVVRWMDGMWWGWGLECSGMER